MFNSDWRTRPVAGIGIVGLDHVAVTDRWERDTKSTANHYFEQVGGPVPVALMAMSRLGMAEPPCFRGIVGRDEAGKTVLRDLKNAGIEVSSIRRVSRGVTGRSLVVLNRGDGTRSLTNFPGEAMLDTTQNPFLAGAESGLLHLDGRELPLALRVAEKVRGGGGKVSLDLGTMRPGRAKLLPYCDIVIASKIGGAGAFPDDADDPIEQTKRFLDGGATVAGVTLGAGGVVIGCRDENGGVPVHLPAFPVENVVDTCGAGDLFHGAFLWAYREGKSVIESATFAQAAVALRIQHYGNVAGQPTREQVEAFLGEFHSSNP